MGLSKQLIKRKSNPLYFTIFATCLHTLLLIRLGGTVITPDSIDYLSSAHSLLHHFDFIQSDGQINILWAPFYPILLALTSILTQSVYISANLLSLVFYATSIFLTSKLFIQNIKNIGILYLSIVVIIVFATFNIYLSALSEGLLSTLFLAEIILMQNVWEDQKKSPLISALLSSFSCITRYIGVVSGIWGIIMLINRPSVTFMQRIRESIYFIIITYIPISIWCIRNKMESGTFAGVRPPAHHTLFNSIYLTLDSFSLWFVSGHISAVVRILVSLFIIILIVILAHKNSKISEFTYKNIPCYYGSIVMILVYSSILIIVARTFYFSHISDRFIMPIAFPALYIIFISIDNGLSYMILKKIKLLLYSYTLFVAVLFVTPIIIGFRSIYKELRFGTGKDGFNYRSQYYQSSRLNEYLQFTKQNSRYMYSVSPEYIYFITGHRTANSISLLHSHIHISHKMTLYYIDFINDPNHSSDFKKINALYNLSLIHGFNLASVYRITSSK